MVLPFTLPDWVPWWVNLAILVPSLLFLLAFLFMPFSVIGVKARLEGIEARLDEIQGEIRSLSLRLPEGVSELDLRDDPRLRPPIPPAPHDLPRPARALAPPPPLAPPPKDRARAARLSDRPPQRERTEPRMSPPA